jgi:hypothetical protein
LTNGTALFLTYLTDAADFKKLIIGDMTPESLINAQDPIWNILIRFLATLLVLTIVLRGIYYRFNKGLGFIFSYFLMGIMIFFLCILLKNVDISLGIGFGLFALFSILRFRTSNFSIKAMTYFFTVIGISGINALAEFYNPVRGPILINSIIIISILLLELLFRKKKKKKKSFLKSHELMYDKLELLNPDRYQDLLSDISARIGRKIEKAEIIYIDLNKGNADLEVFFVDKNNHGSK